MTRHAVNRPSCTWSQVVRGIVEPASMPRSSALSDATRRGVHQRTARAMRTYQSPPLPRTPRVPHGQEEACKRPGAGGARPHRRRSTRGLPAGSGCANWKKRRHGSRKYRQLWAARFDDVGCVVEELRRGESIGRKEKKVKPARTKRPHGGGVEVRAPELVRHPHRRLAPPRAWCSRREPEQNYSGAGGCQNRLNRPLSFLRNGYSRWGAVSFGVSPRRFDDGVLRHVPRSDTLLAPRLDQRGESGGGKTVTALTFDENARQRRCWWCSISIPRRKPS